MDTARREIDLTGIAEVHPRPPARWQRRVGLSVAGCWVGFAVGHLLTGDRWFGLAYGVVAGVQVVAVLLAARRPQATLVRPGGVSLRHGWARTPVPWDDVESIQVQGRWAETSRLRHRDGRLLALPGLAPDQAQRLCDALVASREP